MNIKNILLIAILSGSVLLTVGFLKHEDKTQISSMEGTGLIALNKNNSIPVQAYKQEKQEMQSLTRSSVESTVKKIGLIKVNLPKTAKVFINNKPTYSVGPYREYDVELIGEKQYTFKVVVSYDSGISEARDIVLMGGEEIMLSFSE